MLALLAASLLASAPLPTTAPLSAPGPEGPLAGTLIDAGPGSPVVLILPGSGPTDRDGNSPLGSIPGTYRKLAEALALRSISSVRIDKRGAFGSKAAVKNPDDATLADYVKDVRAWVSSIRARTGAPCVWLVGHSEGGLIALKAGREPQHLCGIVSLAAPGRPLGQPLREQLALNPAITRFRDAAEAMIRSFEAGRRVPVEQLPGPLRFLFPPAVHDRMIELLAQRPAELAASLTLPLLVIQGTHDIQVRPADAQALATAQPGARLVLVEGMNHVLVASPAERVGNLATYRDSSLPLVPRVVEEVAAFVSAPDAAASPR